MSVITRGPGPLSSGVTVSGQVTVGTTAVQLPSVTARRFRLRSLPTNTPIDATIAIGPSGVTSATGYLLATGDREGTPFEVTNLNILYAIASAAGQTLAYLGEV